MYSHIAVTACRAAPAGDPSRKAGRVFDRGKPFDLCHLSNRIAWATKEVLGTRVSAHLFRDAAATTLARRSAKAASSLSRCLGTAIRLQPTRITFTQDRSMPDALWQSCLRGGKSDQCKKNTQQNEMRSKGRKADSRRHSIASTSCPANWRLATTLPPAESASRNSNWLGLGAKIIGTGQRQIEQTPAESA